MKRIAAFVFAFFAVCYFQIADADAQFGKECRYGFCVPGGGPSSTPVSNACISSSGTTITFTAQGIGGARPNRVSLVSINWSDSTAAGTAELTAMTIGGISMTRAVRASGDNQNSNSELWYVLNPTGTTANIVATFSTVVDGITIEVYSLIGYSTAGPVAITTGTTSVSQAYTNKQVAIAAASRTVNVSTSLSNMVNDFSSACGSNLWGVHASQKLHGNGTLTSTISPTSNNPKIAMAVWAVNALGSCTASNDFLLRAGTLDATHTSAYDALICGLVTDNVWSLLDVLHVYATQNSTVSLLNLKSLSFNATNVGSVTFTTDRGYTGTEGSTTAYIETNYGFSSSGAQLTQNAGHLSVWSVTNVNSAAAIMGIARASPNSSSYLLPNQTSSSNAYYNVSSGFSGCTATCTVAAGSTVAHYIASRTASNVIAGYKNGSNVVTSSQASAIPSADTFPVLAWVIDGAYTGSRYQAAAVTMGAALNSTQAGNLYTRLRTYMTAVGVP